MSEVKNVTKEELALRGAIQEIKVTAEATDRALALNDIRQRLDRIKDLLAVVQV